MNYEIVGNQAQLKSESNEPGSIAPIWKRFLAHAFDFFVVCLLCATVTAFTDVFAFDRTMGPIVLVLMTNFAYTTLLEARFQGATLGKKIFNIRAIKDDGSDLTAWDSIKRSLLRLLWAITFFMTSFYALTNKKRKTIYDLLTKTVVISNTAQNAVQSHFVPDEKTQTQKRFWLLINAMAYGLVSFSVLGFIALCFQLSMVRAVVEGAMDEVQPALEWIEKYNDEHQDIPKEVDIERLRNFNQDTVISSIGYQSKTGIVSIKIKLHSEDSTTINLVPVRGGDASNPYKITWVCTAGQQFLISFFPRRCVTTSQMALRLLK